MPGTLQSVASFEGLIEAFEQARSADHPVELAQYLPARTSVNYLATLQELVRVDLEWSWRQGRPVALADYVRRFPELESDKAGLTLITFEEFRLRLEAGEDATPDQYAARFGVDVSDWPLKAHDAALSSRSRSRFEDTPSRVGFLPAQALLGEGGCRFPVVGERFAGFRLLRELGRGAFARVFLAEQDALAGRPVALKIAPNLVGETRTLAQFQHTHIVPIYSAHEEGPLQALCMPYLGGMTLADLLSDLARRPTLPQSGSDLWATRVVLPPADSDLPATMVVPAPACEPAAPASAMPTASKAAKARAEMLPQVLDPPSAPAIQERLERLTFVEAALWLGQCLADGLAHAHERGILHRDLKPANVLITDDGRPMLLDFNLAQDTKLRDGASGALVGGTLPYMSPEHLAAFQGGPRDLDARGDLYSLGVILFQLMTGKYPFATGLASQNKAEDAKPLRLPEMLQSMLEERRRPTPRLRALNRGVSPATEAIVRKCLAADPAQRYQTARELQEDMRRQLESLPLRFAGEPSLRERARKWWRRHPRLPGQLAGVGVVLLAAVALFLMWRSSDHAKGEMAWSCVNGFREDLRATQVFLTAQGDDPEERKKGIALGRKALGRYDILSAPRWRQDARFAGLPAPEQARLQQELGELLLLLARAETWTDLEDGELNGDKRDRLKDALVLNQLAEACFDGLAPRALLWQRADLLRQLGEFEQGEELRAVAERMSPESADDHYLSARELVAEGKTHQAVPLLRQATRLDPRHFWAWFLLGKCYLDMGEDVRAATCYSVCITLQPQSAAAYFNRGLAYLQQKEYAQARADFDQTVALQPANVEAYLNRALTLLALKEPAAAAADLSEAFKHGEPPTRVYFLRARAREAAGDKVGAQADRAEGMRRRPTDEKSWIARGLARLNKEPGQALEDFEQALAVNPRSRAALRNKAHVLAEILDRPQEAVLALDWVVKLYPEFPPAWAERGVVQARLGRRAEAIADGKHALALEDSPALRYQVACIYALTSKSHPEDRKQALALLADALRNGYGFRILADDTDFDPLRDLPEFRRIAQAAAVLK
ncbi:MAG: tetratricopeptide repeat protein [Planctomycetes bacterium]|nr:tetratricopeptide repeat protein [Planctomycetota bacterium]